MQVIDLLLNQNLCEDIVSNVKEYLETCDCESKTKCYHEFRPCFGCNKMDLIDWEYCIHGCCSTCCQQQICKYPSTKIYSQSELQDMRIRDLKQICRIRKLRGFSYCRQKSDLIAFMKKKMKTK